MIYINSMTIATNYKKIRAGIMIQNKKQRKISNFTGKSGENGRIGDERRIQFCRRSIGWKKAELLLYRKGHQKPFLTVPLPEEERTGVISSVEITGLTVGKFSYAYRMDEVFCLDPYAGAVEGRETFVHRWKKKRRLLLPSPGVPGNAHHLTAPAV